VCHTRKVRIDPLERADARIVELADEVKSSRERVVFTRDGEPVAALLSADELESIEATLWWYQDAAERAAHGEQPGEGEDGSGLDEVQARALYENLVRRSTA
jgi:antitoxin YefM